ncbi:MAG: hypothetical protein M0R03_19995 [Novosphingobium sp.]|nr:hypothetical protein [Novosphingobium sp.]
MELIRATIWQASEGKVFKNIATGVIGSELILLAVSDSIENYEEVDKPAEEPTE